MVLVDDRIIVYGLEAVVDVCRCQEEGGKRCDYIAGLRRRKWAASLTSNNEEEWSVVPFCLSFCHPTPIVLVSFCLTTPTFFRQSFQGRGLENLLFVRIR